MNKHIMQTLALLLTLLPLSVTAMPILHIADDTGVLTGASDVEVDGNFYSVDFVDGTCAELFGGCDEVIDFAFTTVDQARLAARALLDTVFINTTLGNFDSDPSLIAGCPGSPNTIGSCLAFVTYSSTIITGQNGDQAFSISANNNPLQFTDGLGGHSGHLDLFHTGDCRSPQFCPPSWAPWSTWTVWTPQVIAAPESGILMLLASGLIAVRLTRKKI